MKWYWGHECITNVLAFAGHHWQFWVHNKPLLMTSGEGLLPPDAPLLEFPGDCTTASVAKLLHSIEKLRVCQGAGIPPVDASKVPHTFVDMVPTPIKEADVQMQTLRDDQCTLLVPTSMLRCQDCTRLKERQRQKALRKSHQDKTSGSSCFTANAYLSTPEKLQKLAILAVNQKDSRRKINTLRSKDWSNVSEGWHISGFRAAPGSGSHCGESQQTLPDGSFRKLFWEQQVKALQNKDPRQRRWHPLIWRWCLTRLITVWGHPECWFCRLNELSVTMPMPLKVERASALMWFISCLTKQGMGRTRFPIIGGECMHASHMYSCAPYMA